MLLQPSRNNIVDASEVVVAGRSSITLRWSESRGEQQQGARRIDEVGGELHHNVGVVGPSSSALDQSGANVEKESCCYTTATMVGFSLILLGGRRSNAGAATTGGGVQPPTEPMAVDLEPCLRQAIPSTLSSSSSGEGAPRRVSDIVRFALITRRQLLECMSRSGTWTGKQNISSTLFGFVVLIQTTGSLVLVRLDEKMSAALKANNTNEGNTSVSMSATCVAIVPGGGYGGGVEHHPQATTPAADRGASLSVLLVPPLDATYGVKKSVAALHGSGGDVDASMICMRALWSCSDERDVAACSFAEVLISTTAISDDKQQAHSVSPPSVQSKPAIITSSLIGGDPNPIFCNGLGQRQGVVHRIHALSWCETSQDYTGSHQYMFVMTADVALTPTDPLTRTVATGMIFEKKGSSSNGQRLMSSSNSLTVVGIGRSMAKTATFQEGRWRLIPSSVICPSFLCRVTVPVSVSYTITQSTSPPNNTTTTTSSNSKSKSGGVAVAGSVIHVTTKTTVLEDVFAVFQLQQNSNSNSDNTTNSGASSNATTVPFDLGVANQVDSNVQFLAGSMEESSHGNTGGSRSRLMMYSNRGVVGSYNNIPDRVVNAAVVANTATVTTTRRHSQQQHPMNLMNTNRKYEDGDVDGEQQQNKKSMSICCLGSQGTHAWILDSSLQEQRSSISLRRPTSAQGGASISSVSGSESGGGGGTGTGSVFYLSISCRAVLLPGSSPAPALLTRFSCSSPVYRFLPSVSLLATEDDTRREGHSKGQEEQQQVQQPLYAVPLVTVSVVSSATGTYRQSSKAPSSGKEADELAIVLSLHDVRRGLGAAATVSEGIIDDNDDLSAEDEPAASASILIAMPRENETWSLASRDSWWVQPSAHAFVSNMSDKNASGGGGAVVRVSQCGIVEVSYRHHRQLFVLPAALGRLISDRASAWQGAGLVGMCCCSLMCGDHPDEESCEQHPTAFLIVDGCMHAHLVVPSSQEKHPYRQLTVLTTVRLDAFAANDGGGGGGVSWGQKQTAAAAQQVFTPWQLTTLYSSSSSGSNRRRHSNIRRPSSGVVDNLLLVNRVNDEESFSAVALLSAVDAIGSTLMLVLGVHGVIRPPHGGGGALVAATIGVEDGWRGLVDSVPHFLVVTGPPPPPPHAAEVGPPRRRWDVLFTGDNTLMRVTVVISATSAVVVGGGNDTVGVVNPRAHFARDGGGARSGPRNPTTPDSGCSLSPEVLAPLTRDIVDENRYDEYGRPTAQYRAMNSTFLSCFGCGWLLPDLGYFAFPCGIAFVTLQRSSTTLNDKETQSLLLSAVVTRWLPSSSSSSVVISVPVLSAAGSTVTIVLNSKRGEEEEGPDLQLVSIPVATMHVEERPSDGRAPPSSLPPPAAAAPLSMSMSSERNKFYAMLLRIGRGCSEDAVIGYCSAQDVTLTERI